MKYTRFMKKATLLYILFVSLFIVCCGTLAYASNFSKDTNNRGIKAVTLFQSETVEIKKLSDAGFNTVLLQVDSIRAVKKPYNTNYHLLKQLYQNIQLLERNQLSYYLCFTSGPGISRDGKTLSIYQNKAEQSYFTKMVVEIIRRYQTNPHLAGVSISLSGASVPELSYYRVQDQILTTLYKNNTQLGYLYTLHPLSFEQGLDKLPLPAIKPSIPNLLVNLPMTLTAVNYPGICAGYRTSVKLDKNVLLSALEKLDGYAKDNELPVLLSIRTPWLKNSDVMLQDIYELLKMFKLNLNLSDGNSQSRHDFMLNKDVLKVISRHNK